MLILSNNERKELPVIGKLFLTYSDIYREVTAMKGQKGQSVVEFAFVIPLFLLLIVGMIYGGFAYADYLQYNNAVRDAARDIAVNYTARDDTVAGLNDNNPAVVKKYANPLTNLYKPTFSATVNNDRYGKEYVQVSVVLELTANTSLLPKELKGIQCTMAIENDLPNDEH